MKTVCFSFILSLVGFDGFAQTRTLIHGEVRNSDTQAAIPYANIGIAEKSVGTVSDSHGVFALKLNSNVKNNDTIVLSHVGFKTAKIPAYRLDQENNIVLLEPEQQALDEVSVTFLKPKPQKIGRSAKGLGLMHMNFYTASEKNVDDRLSKEVGMRFHLNKDCKINDFNFNITSNEFKSLKFRLNFYRIENDLPTKVIGDHDLIFEIMDGYTGWYTVDLKPYNLFLEKANGTIAVTLQWVESVPLRPESKYFGIATALSGNETSYFREKAMDVWKVSKQSLSFYLNAKCR